MDDSHLVKDPVCGKEVDTLRARAVGIFGGVTYYFCSAECKAKFGDPRKIPRDSKEPVWEPGDRPERQRRSTMENWKVLAEATEPSSGEEAKEEVRYAKSKKKRAVEPEESSSSKVSPSIEAEVPRNNSGRVWLIVFVLFAAAGAALFFALKK